MKKTRVPATPKAATMGTARIMGVFKKRLRKFWKNVVGSSVVADKSISESKLTAFKLVDDVVDDAAVVELDRVFVCFLTGLGLLTAVLTNGCTWWWWWWWCTPAKASTCCWQTRTHSKAMSKGENLVVIVIVIVE
jgi:hypothetical protein